MSEANRHRAGTQAAWAGSASGPPGSARPWLLPGLLLIAILANAAFVVYRLETNQAWRLREEDRLAVLQQQQTSVALIDRSAHTFLMLAGSESINSTEDASHGSHGGLQTAREDLAAEIDMFRKNVAAALGNYESVLEGGPWYTVDGEEGDSLLSPAPPSVALLYTSTEDNPGLDTTLLPYLELAGVLAASWDPTSEEIVRISGELGAQEDAVREELAQAHSEASNSLNAEAQERTQTWLIASVVPLALILLGLVGWLIWTHRKRLRWKEDHDDLTGLYSRNAFRRLVDKALGSQAPATSMAIIVIDVDRFAEFNRKHTTDSGDQALVKLSYRLTSELRGDDVAARIGGDELAVACLGAGQEYIADAICQRLLRSLTRPMVVSGGDEASISVSIGATCIEDETITMDAALDRARLALRSAKSAGGGQVEFFTAGLLEAAEAESEMIADLREAIENEVLEVWYQPEVDIESGRMMGVEALVRWNHPLHGFVSPEVFVPLAENHGMVVDLGRYVLRTACRQAGAWLSQFPETAPRLRVNVSARQFEAPDLLADIASAVADAGIAPSTLCLELTESAVMADAEEARLVLEQVANLGVRIAIDDFGTGYSSLQYLSQFPLDVLKLDRSFVAQLETDDTKLAIVSAIVGMADALHLTVTAEGIESPGQIGILLQLGCRLGQGFYFSPPVTAANLEAMLAHNYPSRSRVFDGHAVDDPQTTNHDEHRFVASPPRLHTTADVPVMPDNRS